jgi:hypothetical protein
VSSRARTGNDGDPRQSDGCAVDGHQNKAVTFGVSGLYTGIAGTLGAIVVQFVAPNSFTIYQSLAFLVGLVVGGVGWLPGAFVGAAFILFVPTVAEHFSQGLSGAFYRPNADSSLCLSAGQIRGGGAYCLVLPEEAVCLTPLSHGLQALRGRGAAVPCGETGCKTRTGIHFAGKRFRSRPHLLV